jgi:hypothetical protein
MLYGNNPIITGMSQATEQPSPGIDIVTLADRRKVPRRLCRIGRRREMKYAVTADSLGIEEGVLAVRMADAMPMGLDKGQRINSLPPKMTGIEVQPDVVAHITAKCIETPG